MEGSEGLDLYREDLKALLTQFKNQDSLLRAKHRFLMDLPLSSKEKKLIQETLPDSETLLPESFISEGDLCHEEVRACIERACEVYSKGIPQNSEDSRTPVLQNSFRDIHVLLDDMTSKGLSSLIELLTGRVIKVDRVSDSVKKTVKESFSKLFADNSDVSRKKLKQLSQLLNNTKYFHSDQSSHLPTPEEFRIATQSVIEVLDEFSLRTLHAMKRKLEGVTGYIPTVLHPNQGGRRNWLIRNVRKLLMEEVSHLGEADHTKKILVNALAVASLALKLMNRPPVQDFRRTTPEFEALQDKILKAIILSSDSKGVSLEELKKVQVLLDPNCQLSIRSLRTSVRSFLTEHLLEWTSCDTFPSHVTEIADIINSSSRLRQRHNKSSSKACKPCPEFGKNQVQKEFECALTISSQAKQVILDLLPQLELDEHFDLAYMEDFEGSYGLCPSDDDDDDTGDSFQPYESRLHASFSQAESAGETNPSRLLSADERGLNKPPPKFTHPSADAASGSNKQGSDINQYLEVQQACSRTSMVAYRFAGCVLDRLANSQGLTISKEDRFYLCGSSVPDDHEGCSNSSMASSFQEIWTKAAQL